ncbi:unnamed protein product [Ixodes pacificus]
MKSAVRMTLQSACFLGYNLSCALWPRGSRTAGAEKLESASQFSVFMQCCLVSFLFFFVKTMEAQNLLPNDNAIGNRVPLVAFHHCIVKRLFSICIAVLFFFFCNITLFQKHCFCFFKNSETCLLYTTLAFLHIF